MKNGMENNEQENQKLAEKKKLAAYSNVGMMFPASIAVGGFFGYYLDKWLDTSPIFFLILIFYGIAAGFFNLIKVTRKKKDSKS